MGYLVLKKKAVSARKYTYYPPVVVEQVHGKINSTAVPGEMCPSDGKK